MSNISEQQKIPKNIVQYWSDRNISENLKKLSSSWVEVYPDYNYKLYNRESAIDFLTENYNREVVNAFEVLKVPAMQSDLFRIAYLLANGGMYMDISQKAHKPLNEIIFKINKLIVFSRDSGSIINGMILTPKDNSLLRVIFENILGNISRRDDYRAYHVTGPANFNKVLSNENCVVLKKQDVLKYISGDKLYERKNDHWTTINSIENAYYNNNDFR
ncbi:hypothetical protein FQV37_2845 [Psychrobacter nivimaris]|uniref:Mannosyltransferase OCH1 n=1 Tax=Psychrobacter nivimaris TaxID=281738 RepID=A0A6N7C0G2_9GAMM|nr:glycosyltransferase [Psychrobacter nivimaris]KAF0569364.1 hypothetical protein FQV37_2845 [Psychrobacter nivimaris]|tara:strand:+ start:595 stop:1245 length:651 start_codon:yes stop_codon:yes gene_type:complete